MDDEIRFHLEMGVRANVAAGTDRETARRDAERRFGDPDRVRRAGRELLPDARSARDGAGRFDELWQDVRYGARTLARRRRRPDAGAPGRLTRAPPTRDDQRWARSRRITSAADSSSSTAGELAAAPPDSRHAWRPNSASGAGRPVPAR